VTVCIDAFERGDVHLASVIRVQLGKSYEPTQKPICRVRDRQAVGKSSKRRGLKAEVFVSPKDARVRTWTEVRKDLKQALRAREATSPLNGRY
jgi:hypothetical protein